MTILEAIQQEKQDGILWQAGRWIEAAGEDVMQVAKAIDDIAGLISLIGNEIAQMGYIDAVSAKWKIPKKKLDKALNSAATRKAERKEHDEDELATMPGWMNKEEWMDKGFCTVVDKKNERVGYFGWGNGGKVRISNFIIHPIFHVGAKENSRHIFEVENKKKRAVLDVPSKALVSLETLQNHLVGEGSFVFFGSKAHLLNIAEQLLPHFPMCKELKQLGWQQYGFWSYVNKILVPGEEQKDINQWGIAEYKNNSYLVPAASEVYKDDEAYENDRVMMYVEPKINFRQWAAQMKTVYGHKGLVAIAFSFVTVFCDIVFRIDGNCPFLYLYGERNSGKSKLAESISAVFYVNRKPFQMNSGTDPAFYGYVSQFKNAPAVLNEFDDKVVRDPWFQGTKGFFEGEGRQRNRLDVKNKQETQRAAGTILLLGQFLSTKDDNSIVTRSIIEAFFEREFSDDEKQQYNLLKRWEAEGLTGLMSELLAHRSYIKEEYYLQFNEILSNWRKVTSDQFNQRIFQSWCHLATMWYLLREKLDLPETFTEFENYCYKQAVKWSRFVRDTDILSEFWNTVAYLLEKEEIQEGWDFTIIYASKIKLRGSDGKEYEKTFTDARKLLVIRLNVVHKLYQVNYKSRTGKEGMTFENLKHYYSNRTYYIGQVKQMTFKRHVWKNVEIHGNIGVNIQQQKQAESVNTSAYVFDYDLLGCELERDNPHLSEQHGEATSELFT